VQSPQDIAPTIFELAWRKKYTVAQGLNNGKWMQGLQRMATPEQIQQFIKVWTLAAQVQRTEEPDKITWRFTTNGVYAQFIGSYADYDWHRVWTAQVEHKCRFFAWLNSGQLIGSHGMAGKPTQYANYAAHSRRRRFTSWRSAPSQE
jgi:hypothetical protein